MTKKPGVLIIEYEDGIRSNIVLYLEDCGYRVARADNKNSGPGIFRNEIPFLILLDLTMPGIPGLDFIPIFKNAAEVNSIRLYPQTGYDILKMVEYPWPVAQLVLQRDEPIDGSCYPGGLSGEYILQHAQIMGVADMAESMASHRPYRESPGIKAAINEITMHAGRRYDGRSVDACRRPFTEHGFDFTDGWKRDQVATMDNQVQMVIT